MLIAVGLLLVAYGWWDVFHKLFHPGGSGQLSGVVRRILWPVCRRSRLLLPVAGPLILLAVMVSWAALFALGWALVYWPFLDNGFYFSTRGSGGFGEALYVSLVTLATLGYGDIVPTTEWLRAAATAEALTGFALLTASVTWVLSTYPVLGRRRTLAAEISAVAAVWNEFGAAARATALRNIASGLVRVSTDLAQFPISYYYHAPERRQALPAVALLVADWAEHGAPHEPEALRDARALTRAALHGIVQQRGQHIFAPTPNDMRASLVAYARDHRREQTYE